MEEEGEGGGGIMCADIIWSEEAPERRQIAALLWAGSRLPCLWQIDLRDWSGQDNEHFTLVR